MAELKKEFIEIRTADGICDCFICFPSGLSTYPAVLLYMDAFGPRPYLYEMAETIAEKGYFVLLPNLFYRKKRAPILEMKFPLKKEDMPAAREVVIPMAREFDVQLGLNDAGEFLNFLNSQPNITKNKVGITGYCLGGSLAVRIAAHYAADVKAIASFHAGNLATESEQSPHQLLTKIKAAVYVAHADQDPSMPLEQITKFQNAFQAAAHLQGKVELYGGALHGFTMRDLPAYNAPALQKHWQNLFEHFSSYLN